MPLAPLANSTLHANCYRALKDAIINLELPPGAPLIEQALAEDLGISKTPVREALAQLATEGLATVGPRRRTYVAELSVGTVRNIYRSRLIIEPEAARHVTLLLTEQDCDELEELTNQSMQALELGDARRQVWSSEEFHVRLINFHSNPILTDIIDRLYSQVHRVRMVRHRMDRNSGGETYLREGLSNHFEIIRALRKKDPDGAYRAMRCDIQFFLERMDIPIMQEVLNELAHKR